MENPLNISIRFRRHAPLWAIVLTLSIAVPYPGSAVVETGGLQPRRSPTSAGLADQEMPEQQLVVLRESLYLVSVIGNVIWEQWTQVPLPALVVDDDREFLVNAPPDADLNASWARTEQVFAGRPVYSRPRTLDQDLRITKPVAGVPCAVIGVWDWREESPNEWAVTLAREWFHVLQLHRDERARVESLGFIQADAPLWQLDYDFPFDDPDVGNALHLLGQSLYEFWAGASRLPQDQQRTFAAETAWAALQNFRAMVTLKRGGHAYDFFRFMIWKEGVARYTEVRLARRVAEREIREEYRQRPGFGDLPGAMPYARFWQEVMRTKYWMMRNSGRQDQRNRMSFSAIGHGIAELLDAVDADWKERYFEPGVWLEDLMADALDLPRSPTAPDD